MGFACQYRSSGTGMQSPTCSGEPEASRAQQQRLLRERKQRAKEKITGNPQWDPPEVYVRMAWEQQYDPTTGNAYYVNADLGQTQWDAPEEGFAVFEAENVESPMTDAEEVATSEVVAVDAEESSDPAQPTALAAPFE